MKVFIDPENESEQAGGEQPGVIVVRQNVHDETDWTEWTER
jgi:hypothetical protein